MNFDLYNKENSILFNYIVNKNFFDVWKEKDRKESNFNLKTLELYITSDCNLKCTYCYLNNFGDSLYPKEIRNCNQIIHNISLLLDFIIANKFYISTLDIFSGEIWHTDFGIEILDCIYNHIKKHRFTKKIVIPTNGTFIGFEKFKYKISYFVEEFKKLDVKLILSFSVDGYILDDITRPSKSDRDLNNFYDSLFEFCVSHEGNFGFHPMVSAFGSEYLIDNFKWWSKQLNKFNLPEAGAYMSLEVRNDDWDENSLNNYKEFTIWKFKHFLNGVFNNDKKEMLKFVFRLNKNYKNNQLSIIKAGNKMNCSIQHSLVIRCGDLAIVPCHRLSYNHLILGKFIVNNGKIVGINGLNPELALRIWGCNPNTSMPKCDSCIYQKICPKGCFGSQYEHSYELFTPIECVCKLYKTKFHTIIDLCDEYKIFEEIKKLETDTEISVSNTYMKYINDIKNTKEWRDYYEREP